MKLSRKTFEIQQLVENREDYRILEILYILSISWSYNYWSLDGFNGDIPYNYLSSAENKLEELEQLEEVEYKYRDGSIMLFLIFLAVVLFGVCKLIF